MELTLPARDVLADPIADPPRTTNARTYVRAGIVALLYFCFTLPFLSWTPLTGGMEGNVVVAGRETVREGHWFPATQNAVRAATILRTMRTVSRT